MVQALCTFQFKFLGTFISDGSHSYFLLLEMFPLLLECTFKNHCGTQTAIRFGKCNKFHRHRSSWRLCLWVLVSSIWQMFCNEKDVYLLNLSCFQLCPQVICLYNCLFSTCSELAVADYNIFLLLSVTYIPVPLRVHCFVQSKMVTLPSVPSGRVYLHQSS